MLRQASEKDFEMRAKLQLEVEELRQEVNALKEVVSLFCSVPQEEPALYSGSLLHARALSRPCDAPDARLRVRVGCVCLCMCVVCCRGGPRTQILCRCIDPLHRAAREAGEE